MKRLKERSTILLTAIVLGSTLAAAGTADAAVNLDDVIADYPSKTTEWCFEKAIALANAERLATGVTSRVNLGKNKTYNVLGSVNVNYPVLIQGDGSVPTDLDHMGAGTVNSNVTFTSGKGFVVASNSVIFKNMNVKGVGDNKLISFSGTGVYSNIRISNLVLDNAEYSIRCFKAKTPGITVKFTTFNNFCFRCFEVNRQDLTESIAKMTFNNNEFIPKDSSRPNMRAISLDAGNDEYPVIYNFKGTEIRNNHFNGCGFASSKCENIVIKDNIFTVVENDDAPMHLEEYSNDITIEYNVFDMGTLGQRVSAMGETNNITFDHNIVEGKMGSFASGKAVHDITFTNNDFSAAEVTSSNNYLINFYGGDGNRNIVVQNNTWSSIDSQIIKVTYEKSLGRSGNITIGNGSDNDGASDVLLKEVNPDAPLFNDGDIVCIQNVNTKKVLGYRSGEIAPFTRIGVTNNTMWKVSYMWPGMYSFTHTGSETSSVANQLQVAHGGGDDGSNLSGVEVPLEISNLSGKRAPFWHIEFAGTDAVSHFNLLKPAGDKTSMLDINGAGGAPGIVQYTDGYVPSTQSEMDHAWRVVSRYDIDK